MDSTVLALATAVGSIVAMTVGYFLKKNPEVSNRVIPWVTLLISFLTQIAGAAGSAIAVHAADSLAVTTVAPHTSFLWILVRTLLLTVAQTLGVTGAVSFNKNAIQGKVSGSTG